MQSDERLVALTRRGHQAAFTVLVGRYETRLFAFCRHLLRSREDAEDVLQDVFASAFKAMLADERPITVRPWLYRIARNRCLNHLRRCSAIGVDSIEEHVSEHGPSTSEAVQSREDLWLLVGDIRALPESQRSALLLRELEALSYEQIAEVLEKTVPSVKSLLIRARRALAEAAEARSLTCIEVMAEVGECHVSRHAKPSRVVRRHIEECPRCAQLPIPEERLAAVRAWLPMPLAPLLALKKLILSPFAGSAKAGSTATATAAGSSATAAGTSATAAGTSATAAGTSAAGSTAAGASAAGASATAAGTSATAAGTTAAGSTAAGASAAGASATAAGTSATAAAAGSTATGAATAVGAGAVAAPTVVAGSTAGGLVTAGVTGLAGKAAVSLTAIALGLGGAAAVESVPTSPSHPAPRTAPIPPTVPAHHAVLPSTRQSKVTAGAPGAASNAKGSAAKTAAIQTTGATGPTSIVVAPVRSSQSATLTPAAATTPASAPPTGGSDGGSSILPILPSTPPPPASTPPPASSTPPAGASSPPQGSGTPSPGASAPSPGSSTPSPGSSGAEAATGTTGSTGSTGGAVGVTGAAGTAGSTPVSGSSGVGSTTSSAGGVTGGTGATGTTATS